MALSGRATPDGTRRFVSRFDAVRESRGYREAWGCSLSSIGLGTYLGSVSREQDAGYLEAAKAAVAGGVNVLDTAINYRHQRSERVLGQALSSFVEGGGAREEVFVSTKGGYLALDADLEDPHQAVHDDYVESGLVTPETLVVDAHCMAPDYLKDQIRRSRQNLALETLDLYYVHNPETQLAQVDRKTFDARLKQAFVALEQAIQRGEIARYGLATWQGLRAPVDHKAHLGLERIVTLAEEAAAEAGAENHGLQAVQAPLNLMMPEAVTVKNQKVAGETVSLAHAVEKLGLGWFTSASIMQGKLAEGLPFRLRDQIGAVGDAAQTALQATRSAPGVTSALVGMAQKKHVESALDLLVGSPPGASGVWPGG